MKDAIQHCLNAEVSSKPTKLAFSCIQQPICAMYTLLDQTPTGKKILHVDFFMGVYQIVGIKCRGVWWFAVRWDAVQGGRSDGQRIGSTLPSVGRRSGTGSEPTRKHQEWRPGAGSKNAPVNGIAFQQRLWRRPPKAAEAPSGNTSFKPWILPTYQTIFILIELQNIGMILIPEYCWLSRLMMGRWVEANCHKSLSALAPTWLRSSAHWSCASPRYHHTSEISQFKLFLHRFQGEILRWGFLRFLQLPLWAKHRALLLPAEVAGTLALSLLTRL